MEDIIEGYNLIFLTAVLVIRLLACQLQRRFVGLRAIVAEKRLVGKGGVNKLLRQTQHRLVGVTITQMPQFTSPLH